MIKTLQKKFIITAMSAVSILLIVLVGAINAANYYITDKQSDGMILALTENMGMFPPKINPGEGRKPNFFAPPIDKDDAMSARYFIVFSDSDGNIIKTDVSRISSVTPAEAEEIADEILSGGRKSGSKGRFKYKVTENVSGEIMSVFLDTSSQLYSIFIVMVISVSVGILCWTLMLLLVAALSKKAIFPIAANIEKQKQFVTNAGHEIKTPLAIIMANVDAMELHNGGNKWSRNIRSQTERLDRLMKNLLTLAKMDEGGGFPRERFSLSGLFAEMLEPFYELAELNDTEIKADIEQDVAVYANKENIIQLISILLDNAAKYTDKGGRIDIELKRTDSGAEFCIKNTCSFLPEGRPEKLFDRFYRGDSARTQKNGGYGVGLSVAAAIVEIQKGEITAEYGKGNEISFKVRI